MAKAEGRRNDEAPMTKEFPTGAPPRSALRTSHSSFVMGPSSFPAVIRHSRRGFTLIEMLIVVAIMATLAALTFPILGAVKKTMIRNRATGAIKQLEAAIDAYQAKFGQYPPDNGGYYSTNQLYFELLGTTNVQVGSTTNFVTLDGSATMAASDVPLVFNNVGGFVNCSRAGSVGDEAPTGTSFIPNGLKANQFAAVPMNGRTTWVLGAALDGPLAVPTAVNGQKINPVCYNSSNPRYNTKSYDLWIDVTVGGKTNRISNWSDQPILVSTPY
jgi:prepilin-type N-terminal cleavage/methylation domain-containing protein